jgi:hypothetical protein
VFRLSREQKPRIIREQCVIVMVVMVNPSPQPLTKARNEGQSDLRESLVAGTGESHVEDNDPARKFGWPRKLARGAEGKFRKVKYGRRHPTNCWTAALHCPPCFVCQPSCFQQFFTVPTPKKAL